MLIAKYQERHPVNMPDILKDLLRSWYKQNAALATIAIFVFYNAFALLTWLWVRHSAQELKQPDIQIQVNAPVTTGNCSAAAIGQASGVSIQCDDKAAAAPTERKESGQKK
jgi:hypothetical protein